MRAKVSPTTALGELRAALAKRGNVKLLELLVLAEGKLGDGAMAARRGRTKRVTYERLSPNGYWPDGSLRCPYEDIPGESACDYHEYSGCTFDAPDVHRTTTTDSTTRTT